MAKALRRSAELAPVASAIKELKLKRPPLSATSPEMTPVQLAKATAFERLQPPGKRPTPRHPVTSPNLLPSSQVATPTSHQPAPSRAAGAARQQAPPASPKSLIYPVGEEFPTALPRKLWDSTDISQFGIFQKYKGKMPSMMPITSEIDDFEAFWTQPYNFERLGTGMVRQSTYRGLKSTVSKFLGFAHGWMKVSLTSLSLRLFSNQHLIISYMDFMVHRVCSTKADVEFQNSIKAVEYLRQVDTRSLPDPEEKMISGVYIPPVRLSVLSTLMVSGMQTCKQQDCFQMDCRGNNLVEVIPVARAGAGADGSHGASSSSRSSSSRGRRLVMETIHHKTERFKKDEALRIVLPSTLSQHIRTYTEYARPALLNMNPSIDDASKEPPFLFLDRKGRPVAVCSLVVRIVVRAVA
ncbi:hypothetical protein VOLCADRAFT_88112 [Volvox carteri f. nagariensis]|uniref:Uncharacterized protein n=1 Tax=Volvox carteri f. nagariensis TaxID=3068 RepID=D8TNB2_VOLCA|nr:uncharacterized protein VOLCADRAFT_88112 [Volvox carteri f. nagariensis]EFJ50959.1 hypothetical protein VOLCADRAFT_88112 [Volvox carteri f. nagariensis]|eukprot:XP_002947971.1 hypothetical protein VOLCADRAFT_88112 [Volvox carteri f. nagariensis]